MPQMKNTSNTPMFQTQPTTEENVFSVTLNNDEKKDDITSGAIQRGDPNFQSQISSNSTMQNTQPLSGIFSMNNNEDDPFSVIQNSYETKVNPSNLGLHQFGGQNPIGSNPYAMANANTHNKSENSKENEDDKGEGDLDEFGDFGSASPKHDNIMEKIEPSSSLTHLQTPSGIFNTQNNSDNDPFNIIQRNNDIAIGSDHKPYSEAKPADENEDDDSDDFGEFGSASEIKIEQDIFSEKPVEKNMLSSTNQQTSSAIFSTISAANDDPFSVIQSNYKPVNLGSLSLQQPQNSVKLEANDTANDNQGSKIFEETSQIPTHSAVKSEDNDDLDDFGDFGGAPESKSEQIVGVESIQTTSGIVSSNNTDEDDPFSVIPSNYGPVNVGTRIPEETGDIPILSTIEAEAETKDNIEDHNQDDFDDFGDFGSAPENKFEQNTASENAVEIPESSSSLHDHQTMSGIFSTNNALDDDPFSVIQTEYEPVSLNGLGLEQPQISTDSKADGELRNSNEMSESPVLPVAEAETKDSIKEDLDDSDDFGDFGSAPENELEQNTTDNENLVQTTGSSNSLTNLQTSSGILSSNNTNDEDDPFSVIQTEYEPVNLNGLGLEQPQISTDSKADGELRNSNEMSESPVLPVAEAETKDNIKDDLDNSDDFGDFGSSPENELEQNTTNENFVQTTESSNSLTNLQASSGIFTSNNTDEEDDPFSVIQTEYEPVSLNGLGLEQPQNSTEQKVDDELKNSEELTGNAVLSEGEAEDEDKDDSDDFGDFGSSPENKESEQDLSSKSCVENNDSSNSLTNLQTSSGIFSSNNTDEEDDPFSVIQTEYEPVNLNGLGLEQPQNSTEPKADDELRNSEELSGNAALSEGETEEKHNDQDKNDDSDDFGDFGSSPENNELEQNTTNEGIVQATDDSQIAESNGNAEKLGVIKNEVNESGVVNLFEGPKLSEHNYEARNSDTFDAFGDPTKPQENHISSEYTNATDVTLSTKEMEMEQQETMHIEKEESQTVVTSTEESKARGKEDGSSSQEDHGDESFGDFGDFGDANETKDKNEQVEEDKKDTDGSGHDSFDAFGDFDDTAESIIHDEKAQNNELPGNQTIQEGVDGKDENNDVSQENNGDDSFGDFGGTEEEKAKDEHVQHIPQNTQVEGNEEGIDVILPQENNGDDSFGDFGDFDGVKNQTEDEQTDSISSIHDNETKTVEVKEKDKMDTSKEDNGNDDFGDFGDVRGPDENKDEDEQDETRSAEMNDADAVIVNDQSEINDKNNSDSLSLDKDDEDSFGDFGEFEDFDENDGSKDTDDHTSVEETDNINNTFVANTNALMKSVFSSILNPMCEFKDEESKLSVQDRLELKGVLDKIQSDKPADSESQQVLWSRHMVESWIQPHEMFGNASPTKIFNRRHDSGGEFILGAEVNLMEGIKRRAENNAIKHPKKGTTNDFSDDDEFGDFDDGPTDPDTISGISTVEQKQDNALGNFGNESSINNESLNKSNDEFGDFGDAFSSQDINNDVSNHDNKSSLVETDVQDNDDDEFGGFGDAFSSQDTNTNVSNHDNKSSLVETDAQNNDDDFGVFGDAFSSQDINNDVSNHDNKSSLVETDMQNNDDFGVFGGAFSSQDINNDVSNHDNKSSLVETDVQNNDDDEFGDFGDAFACQDADDDKNNKNNFVETSAQNTFTDSDDIFLSQM